MVCRNAILEPSTVCDEINLPIILFSGKRIALISDRFCMTLTNRVGFQIPLQQPTIVVGVNDGKLL
jgi:hypothetical protein